MAFVWTAGELPVPGERLRPAFAQGESGETEAHEEHRGNGKQEVDSPTMRAIWATSGGAREWM